MFFLLRMAFWLGIVLLLLPSAPGQPDHPTSTVGASDAISAASATVGDLRQFCQRQPNACVVGSQLAAAIGYRARAGAKMVYDMLSEALGPHQTGSLARGKEPGNVAAPDRLGNASQDTLTPADMAPAWRGPPVRKDAQHA